MDDIDIILGDSELCQIWLNNIVEDFLNNDYRVADDKNTKYKIAVIRHTAKRLQRLENALRDMHTANARFQTIMAQVL